MAQLKELYPNFYYHHVTNQDGAVDEMIAVRGLYITLGQSMLDTLPEGRTRSICMTHLEDALMRSIQALAVEYGTLEDPYA